jgi:hypothetical protein
MKGKGWNSWPDITSAQVDAKMRGLPQGTSVAVMTYASDLFSWYAGSVEADVYFCPERHGTYYGGFYIKDAPAIGHEGYSINEQLTATAGEALSDASKGYVTAAQAEMMGTLVEMQRDNLYAAQTVNIVQLRTEIATSLRTLLDADVSPTVVRARVLELSAIYGDLDGENNYNYATVFAQIYRSLSGEQLRELMALRKSIMSGTYADGTPFDFTECSTPFLYSAVINDPSVLEPYVSNTDYLFFLASGLRYSQYFAVCLEPPISQVAPVLSGSQPPVSTEVRSDWSKGWSPCCWRCNAVSRRAVVAGGSWSAVATLSTKALNSLAADSVGNVNPSGGGVPAARS